MANMFRLFPYLNFKIDKTGLIAKSNYKAFYAENSFMFSKYPVLRNYDVVATPFSLIEATIILQGLKNKIQIEQTSALYMEANLRSKMTNQAVHSRLAYFYDGKERIFVPFFSRVCNRPYDQNLPSLLKPPFNSLATNFQDQLIDPFYAYGYKIFNSLYTDLIMVGESEDQTEKAFYSVDLEMIFVIDDQGTLEETIPIFDGQIIDKRKDHLLSSVCQLMDAYFSLDKNRFIDDLFNFHLISLNLYQDLLTKEEGGN